MERRFVVNADALWSGWPLDVNANTLSSGRTLDVMNTNDLVADGRWTR